MLHRSPPRRSAWPAACAAWSAFSIAFLLAGPAAAQVAPPATGVLVRDTVHAEALEGNLLGDPADQPVAVYLPPEYDDDLDSRYPVLYLLHGIGGSPDDWVGPGYQDMEIAVLLDSLIGAGAIEPLIVVMPNGTNRYVGSYYRDSPVSGGWDTYLWRDLVAHVDRTYRTIPRAESRGVAGHSMGGYGAIRLGMHRPNVFSAVWAMNPCCLALVADISIESPGLHGALAIRSLADLDAALEPGELYPVATVALAAVLSPRPDQPPLYVELPFAAEGDSLRPIESVATEWRKSFPVAEARAQVGDLRRLRGLRFDTAFEDEFTHIPPGAQMLADTLAALGVPHVFEMYEGDHRSRMRERMTTLVLPYFSSVLVGQEAPPAP